MKLQDVILKAMAKKLTWIQAAEIAGMSVRQMQRKRQAYVDHGYNGLFDKRRGKISYHRVPMATAERVLALYRDKYPDFNVRHFHEKLTESEDISLSYSWVKQALQGAGLVARKKKRGPHRRRRPRRPLPGMLLHIDGSKQSRLPQELRLADIATVEQANRFLRERYIAEFNHKFTVKAAERGTAFRRCGRSDLDWIFSIQTDRVVGKDNTVAVRDQWWQLDKSRWRHSLAGQTVTIHQHLDGTVSIRYGPHVVGRGKDGALENQNPVFHRSLEIASGDSHFPTAPTTNPLSPKPKAKRVA